MITFLRCLGILNAAVWFGGAVFFTVAVAPGVFSPELERLLGPKYYRPYAGIIIEAILYRAFFLQLVCSVLALFHVLGERLYFGRTPGGLRLWLLAALIALTLTGGFIIQPRIKKLHEIKYSTQTVSEQRRQEASQSLDTWHRAAVGVNCFILVGLAVYVCRVGQRPD